MSTRPSQELLEIINCNNYIISTNGKKHAFPHKESLARIIVNPDRNKEISINFYFNYKYELEIFTQEECKHHNFSCYFANESQKYLIF